MPVSQLNAREIDIHNSEHVKLLVGEIDNEQNRRRKREAWVLNQCKEGNQREYVLQELARLYPKTHQKFRVGDINIPKKIDRKLNKAYKNQPIRKCKSNKEDQALEDFYDSFHFGRSFKEADSIYNLHKYVCMWLTWQNPDKVLDRSFILNRIWGKDVYVTPRTVDTHVANLRKKIEDHPEDQRYLVGVRGVGYRFSAD